MNQESTNLQDGLTTTLDDLIKVYRNLLETVRKEKDILISTNLDDLNENNRTKEAMLLRIRQLEETRITQARELCTSLNISSESPRLLEIARVIGGDLGDRLRNMHSVLELLLKRVQELNKQNEVLVKSALDNVTGAMRAIRDTLQDKPTYERRGEVKTGSAPAGQLVSREA